MLCSQCSERVKPIVAFDIDGTMGQYHDHLHAFMEGYFGVELPSEWTGFPFDWEEHLEISKSDYRDAKLAFRQGGMKRTMPVFQGAAHMTDVAWDLGAEVWVTTTRPWQRLDSVDPDTQFWLSKNGIRYDRLLYDEHKYARLAEIVDRDRVVFILDDLEEMWREAREHFEDAAYLICRTHNLADRLDWNHPRTVESLDEATEIMTSRIERWHNEHNR